eukprot:960121_1
MFRIVEDGLTASHLEAESWLTALRAYDPKRADEIERDIKNRIAIITKANNSNNNAFSSFQDDSKETEDPWAARTRRNMAARKNLSDQTDMVFSSDDMIAKFCVLPHINTSNGFRVKASNPRKLKELISLHNGSAVIVENEVSTFETKHKEAAKSLLLDLGESSLPAVAYTGAEFNLSSVPHLRTSLIMCGTAQDMRYLMQWRGDGRQSRMHIVTAQRIISCSSKSYYTTNNWMKGIREYSLHLNVNHLTSCLQIKSNKYIDTLTHDKYIDWDRYFKGRDIVRGIVRGDDRVPLWTSASSMYCSQTSNNPTQSAMTIQEMVDENVSNYEHISTQYSTFTTPHINKTKSRIPELTNKSPIALPIDNNRNTNHNNNISVQSQVVDKDTHLAFETALEFANGNNRILASVAEEEDDDMLIHESGYYKRCNRILSKSLNFASQSITVQDESYDDCPVLEPRNKCLHYHFKRYESWGVDEELTIDEHNIKTIIRRYPHWPVIERDGFSFALVPLNECHPVVVHAFLVSMEQGIVPAFVPQGTVRESNHLSIFHAHKPLINVYLNHIQHKGLPVLMMQEALVLNSNAWSRLPRKVNDMASVYQPTWVCERLGIQSFADIVCNPEHHILITSMLEFYASRPYYDVTILAIYSVLFRERLCIQTDFLSRTTQSWQSMSYSALQELIWSSSQRNNRRRPPHPSIQHPPRITKPNLIEPSQPNEDNDPETGLKYAACRANFYISDRMITTTFLLFKDWAWEQRMDPGEDGQKVPTMHAVKWTKAYSNLRQTLARNCNSQSGAGLAGYAFNLLSTNGVIDGAWDTKDKWYFILLPHEIEKKNIKFYYELLMELSHVNWNDTRNGRKELRPLSTGFTNHFKTLTMIYNLHSQDAPPNIYKPRNGEDWTLQWLEGSLDWRELYRNHGVDAESLTKWCLRNCVARQLMHAKQQNTKKTVTNKKRSRKRKRDDSKQEMHSGETQEEHEPSVKRHKTK